MIFYFSGTGNSAYIAQSLARENSLSLISIAEEMKNKDNGYSYRLEEGEPAGFVFPVYAWGPPRIVTDFASKITFESKGKPYIFAVCTCGDEAGNTMDILKKALAKAGLTLASGYSVVMPNNYIIGFDTDPPEVEKKKQTDARSSVDNISEAISLQREGFKIKKGKFSFLKSGIVYGLFNRYALNGKKFYVTGACTECGLCERICPTGNIRMDPKPIWGNSCTQCLACIHRCPARAIEYGKSTVKKGRYVNHEGIFDKTFE
ncbi:hypothetical protein SDC9_163133 [bioreactor metagenome]|uniref:4Fe-4S ferredoxin-type domain-containing protein n=1 Tax=bioreactor metagenome TaxID=1076179 RepID=A0A645FMZ7_9ZZZZ